MHFRPNDNYRMECRVSAAVSTHFRFGQCLAILEGLSQNVSILPRWIYKG
jgi:hypothetical protein